MPALREIFANFGVSFDSSQLRRGNTQVVAATQRIRQFGQLLVGSLVVRGIGRFVTGTLDMADNLDKVAIQVGLSTAELQGFSHAAALGGVDAGAFANAMGQLQRKANDANEGLAEASDAFAQAGVSFRDDEGNLLSGADLLRNVADGLSNVENESVRTALSMELMGRSGRRMLPMFLEGAEGLDRMAGELDALGGGLSQDFIDRSVEINDNITRWKLALLSLRSTVLVAVLPTINRVVLTMTELSTTLSRMPGLTALLTAAFVALGVAAVAAAVRTAAAWLAAGWPILLVAVVVALLAVAVQDLWTTWKGGDSMMRRFINEIFPGMVDGLDSTDQAIMAVTEAIGTVITAMENLGAMAAPLGDIITAPFRPILGVARLINDLASGRSLGSSASRFAGTMTADAAGLGFGGESGSLIGVDPDAAARRARREGAASATSDILGGDALRRQRHLDRVESMRPSHLQPQARAEQRIAVDQRSDVTVNIHDAGIMTPDETARLARREVAEALGQHSRSMREALIPGPLRTEFAGDL